MTPMTSEETFPLEPSLEFVFAAKVRVDPPMILADEAGVQRRVVPILGGPVEGPRLKGEVLPFGADWQVVREDGTTEVLARYIIRTEDGTMISVVNQGIRRASPAVIRRLLAGERVDPSQVYFRAAPTFEAPDGPHRWLAENLFITAGQRRPDSVEIRFYVVR
jgi:hypothetical protein